MFRAMADKWVQFYDDAAWRRLVNGIACCYVFVALYGVIMYADLWDTERALTFSFIGLPSLCLFIVLFYFRPRWWATCPRIFLLWWLLNGVLCSWGVFMTLNALEDQETTPVVIEVGGSYLKVAHKRGAFGWLYRNRF